MASLYKILFSVLLCHVICFLKVVIGNSHSHWCPAIEMRRISCLKNVTIGQGPPVLRRVYQWKKEMVLRCCPGFMGPTCEKACFSCQQWAEVTGKIHHIEQYLGQNPMAHRTGDFQPFRQDLSARQVCWTKDGRPVHGNINPMEGGEKGGRRWVSSGRGGQDAKGEIERFRTGRRATAATYKNGCPIYSRRDGAGVGGSGSLPYHSQQQQQQQQQQHHNQRNYQRHQPQPKGEPSMIVNMDARRIPRNKRQRQGFVPSHNSQASSSGYSPYQKHPPVPSEQRQYAEFKAAEMVVSLESPMSSSPPPSSLRKPTRRGDTSNVEDNEDDDVDVLNGRDDGIESALQTRLSSMETHISQLEGKLRTLSPALTSVTALQDELGQLTRKIESLQAHLETSGKTKQTQVGRKRDDSPSNQNKNKNRGKRRLRKRKRHNRRRGKFGETGRKPNDNSRKTSKKRANQSGISTTRPDPITGRVTEIKRAFIEGHLGTTTSSPSEKENRNNQHVKHDGIGKTSTGNEKENKPDKNDQSINENSGLVIKKRKNINPNQSKREVTTDSSLEVTKTVTQFSQAEGNANMLTLNNPNINSSLTTNGQNSTQGNHSSQQCQPFCGRRHSVPPPPLPDKEVVQALFSTSSSIVDALDKGHQEFYQELKKVLDKEYKKHDVNVTTSLGDDKNVESHELFGDVSGIKQINITEGENTKGIRLLSSDHNKNYQAHFLMSTGNSAPSTSWSIFKPFYNLYNIILISIYLCNLHLV